MATHYKKIIFILTFLSSFPLVGNGALLKYFSFPEAAPNGQKSSGLSLFSSIDQRKKQLEKLTTSLSEIANKNKEENKTLVEAIQKIDNQLENIKARLKEKPDDEFLNKEISILNEHKQTLLARQELNKENPIIVENHIKLIQSTVSFLKNRHKLNLKSVYSWSELKEAQNAEAELLEKIEAEKAKRDNLQKQQTSEREAIASLQKQVDVKTKERDKIINTLKNGSEQATSLKYQRELLDDEISLIKERILTTEKKVEKFTQEIDLKNDVIDLLQSKFANKKEFLVIVEKRLVLDTNDVEIARAETNDIAQKAFSLKEELNKKIEEKKLEKGQREPRINFLTKHLEQLSSNKKSSARTKIDYLLTQSELQKQQVKSKSIEREISLLIAKKDLADTEANTKELVYQKVVIRYKLSRGNQDLDELIAKFKNQRDLEINILKRLQDNHKETTKELINTNNELEAIKHQEEKILSRKDTIFVAHQNVLQKILSNLEEAKKTLNEQLQFNNKYLAINADLINSREKIINQYALIAQYIENYKLLKGIWKRSPKAITFEEFKQSWGEAEIFFAQFFWDTPTHLGPAAIFESLKTINLNTIISLVLFILFFMSSFFLLKICLFFLLKKAQKHLSADSKRISFLPLNIIIAFLEFARDHFITIFTWFFLLLHISFNFQYCFSTISFLKNRYNFAMFYLITIFVLLHLSRHLLASLKELNRRLSFLFFAEKLQDKFILLITCFCYSTAIFIPLRLAFLSYFYQETTVFQDVLLAAYSLTLVVVLLLFFSKEDVLRLIPSGKTFLTWIKQQIDHHYYPVFFFLMSLLILSNPYIGYSNLAWYLALAVPSTIMLLYLLFIAHHYIRKYAVFMFMKEEEEEIIDKFEHAKTYYGIFVIFSFLSLLFITFLFIARIWRFNYMPGDIWSLLSDVWVIPIGATHKLGFVQLCSLALFIIGGFLTSSLVNKFVLNKLYDILRTEPGTQNTISKILHYFSIGFATCLGFIFIHLDSFIWYIGTLTAVGLGFALKDIMADYVAGFFILIERPIEIGSFVVFDHNTNTRGTVHKIDARTTTIMTRLNHSVVIPNKDLINKTITNWGKGRFAVGFEMRICVDYNMEPDLVKKTILEVIQSNPTVLRVPNIVVRLEEFEESAFYFMARAFISSRRVSEQWNIMAAIREGLVKSFRQKGIVFAFPQRVLHMGERKGTLGTSQGETKSSPIEFKFDV